MTRTKPRSPLLSTVIALVVGVFGVVVLGWLGTWQLQRLAWKEAILTEIETRIAAACPKHSTLNVTATCRWR